MTLQFIRTLLFGAVVVLLMRWFNQAVNYHLEQRDEEDKEFEALEHEDIEGHLRGE